MKVKLLYTSTIALSLSLFVLCGNSKDNSSIKEENPPIINKENFIIGATLNHRELKTIKEELFLKDFKYLTPANAAKQEIIHPTPNVWNWKWVDDFIDFSKKHDLQLRLHGPISPQSSKWAKEDHRTAEELDQNMTEFLTAFAMRFNNEPTVKWMDVVNETIIEKTGKWLGDKPGVDAWENPWFKMGVDENGYPLFILKAFEIATEHAPNIKLVYNLQGGMQAPMWNKLKETVLYLRSKGSRVDGIGWQAHIMFNNNSSGFVVNMEEEAKKLADLIDWAHQNDLEFHVTELDYFVKDSNNLDAAYKKQAEVYQKIVDILIEKSKNGVVTLNLWDMGERFKKDKGYFYSIYDSKFEPTPAYKTIINALEYQNK
ncbi:Endo-1,4-beta-xylanase, GH35 family [Lutibacter agarilyticus]|uniref:endo-1,4-beta-xylanase n=1 Tax=Lutibacter agarilyticus TaxID=1109740 RepID=A0A238Z5W4_9FLAO|nr:endo-1,4-beta-xylanase [Lutibacter agarilyticus]SNR78223.1 Endo-1,4-beta-xylanase, GH35 family [Lutibacter agarilyticus]